MVLMSFFSPPHPNASMLSICHISFIVERSISNVLGFNVKYLVFDRALLLDPNEFELGEIPTDIYV